MDLQNIIQDITQAVEADPTLNDVLRDEAMQIIESVITNPTPENLQALSLLSQQIGLANRYLGETAYDLAEDDAHAFEETIPPQVDMITSQ